MRGTVKIIITDIQIQLKILLQIDSKKIRLQFLKV